MTTNHPGITDYTTEEAAIIDAEIAAGIEDRRQQLVDDWASYTEPEPEATVYRLPGCVQCDQTERHMDKLKIPYRTVDLSEDTAARERFKAEGLQGAPVVETRSGDRWTGFRYEKIKSLGTTQRSAATAAVSQKCFGAARSAPSRPAGTPEARRAASSAAASAGSEVSR